MPETRRTAPAGRHEASPRRGAHERPPGRPRHAAPPRPPVPPLLAALTTGVVVVLAVSLVRGGALESARAIGLPVPPFFTPSISDAGGGSDEPQGDPLVDPASGAFGTAGPTTTSVTYTSMTTGEVVVLGADPAGGATTTSVTPWFPPVDDAGVPVPSTSAPGTPTPTDPPEIPWVPIEWTSEPTPSPTPGEPTPSSSVEPSPDLPAPTFEPSSPGPGLTPTPTVDAPAPTPDPTTPSAAPTTAAPAPTTPTATPTVGPASALRFRPPTLSSPTVLAFPENGTKLSLDTSKDYIVTLPRGRALVNPNGLHISGGRNIVIIGGAVDVRDGVGGVRRGMYLNDATPNGTTYVEGVRFLSSTTGSLTEGVDLASPGATVVLQNLALDGTLSGSQTTNHADAIQAWAGPRVLQVDGFSARTEYQGLFLLPNQHSSAPVADWSLHRISLTAPGSRYLLWRDNGSFAIRTSDVYVSGSQIANGGLWPNAAAWPGVTVGRAPEAYAASAGAGYVSPGYR